MTLRTRLTVLAAVAVAVAVVLVAVIAYGASRNQQRDAFDDALRTEARAAASRSVLLVELGRARPERVDALVPEGLRFQVLSPLGRRRPPGALTLPVDEEELAVAQGRAAEAQRDIEVDGDRYAMVTLPVAPLRATAGEATGAVQVARSLGPLEETLGDLRRTLLLVAALGVAAAAGIGMVVARRALRPVAALTATAEHVAATQQLDARIEVQRPDELGRLAGSFNAMLAALATSREQQHRLVTDASHELRTPLTALRTNVELLQRAGDLPDAERRQIVDDAVGELEELSALVAELVELATDAGRATEEWSAVRLDEVVERAVDRARRRSRLDIVVSAEVTTVQGSASLLERAIGNLLDNAAKWSPPAGRVEVLLAGGRLTVSDQGPGIAEGDLPHVWDRFWRAADAQDVPGSGLGLAIVREVVEAHGGRVEAANRPAGGAVIGFWLPMLAP